MKFRVYKHIVIEEQFIGAFSQTMDAAIFIGAYYKQYPDASLYVRTNGHMRHIDRGRDLDQINTQLVEMTIPHDWPTARAPSGAHP